MTKILKAIFISARPKQWVKNLFVLAALVFVKEFVNPRSVSLALSALALFCLASSGVYMINDVCDVEADRQHPSKKNRPLAVGLISQPALTTVGLLCLALSLIGGVWLNQLFALTLGSYILLNFLYSFWLKRIVFIDVMSIAIGFVLRAVAGAVAISVPFSVWLLLCTFFLTLFLAIGKRKSELLLVGQTTPAYSAALLDQMNSVVMPATLIAYSFYTFSSPHSQWLMVTIPFVVYGLFRYLYIINTKEKIDNGPSDDFLYDRPLQFNILFWFLVALVILIYAQ